MMEASTRASHDLHGVAETCLIALAARARDSRAKQPILGDMNAALSIDSISCDLSKLQMTPVESSSVAIRTRVFDQWTTDFLTTNPGAMVLHLGCGLDSRSQRVSSPAPTCWIDVDLHAVVALRLQLKHLAMPDRSYQLLAADITQSDWLEGLPNDRPTIVIMEGLLSYLTESDVRSLLERLIVHFPEGEILFDCVNSWMLSQLPKVQVGAVRKTGAIFQSAMDDLTELEEIGNDVRVLDALRFVEAPDIRLLPLKVRFRMWLLSWIPGLRDAVRIVRLRFGPA